MIWLMPLISGLGTWAATGDFKKGLLSAALGAGIGGIASSLGGAAGAASSVGTDLATKVGTEVVSKGSQAGIQAANAATGLSGELATSGLNMIPQGIQAAGKAAQVAGAAPGGGNQIMQAGAEFLQRKPVTAGLMLSALSSSAMAPKMEQEERKKGEPFADQYQTTDRSTLPFTGGPPPGPSTYTRNDGFTPDNPYRYAQYEGEKMFFDRPGLERGADGGIPALPDGPESEGSGGLLSILQDRIRGRTKKRFAVGGLLKGPGDGQSDNIEAAGPEGRVLLSEGEFVIPADVVAALGAGSTDAGAKRLYSAMDKIRTQSYGSAKQAKRPSRIAL